MMIVKKLKLTLHHVTKIQVAGKYNWWKIKPTHDDSEKTKTKIDIISCYKNTIC